MSLRKANINIPYQTFPPRSRTVTNIPDGDGYVAIEFEPVSVSIPRDTVARMYRRLKDAEQPRVSFQDDQGAMFMEAFRLREKIIKEVLTELEAYV